MVMTPEVIIDLISAADFFFETIAASVHNPSSNHC